MFVEEKQNALESLINFYDECSNASLISVKSSTEINFPVQIDENSDIETFPFEGSVNFLEEIRDIELHENSSKSRSLVICGSSSSSSNQANENSIFDKRFCSDRLNAVSVVSPVNLTASLLTLMSKHNGSDALLNDLLKRGQALFGERAITPWTVKTQF